MICLIYAYPYPSLGRQHTFMFQHKKDYIRRIRNLFGKREVNKKTKTQVYSTVLEPILTYGSESWTPTKMDISKVNAVQMKCLRRIAGKTRRDCVRNERIRDELSMESIEKKIQDRQLLWYGHITRMDEDRTPKRFHLAKAQGRRPIGRPRTTWEETVTRVAGTRGKSANQLQTLAQDRVNFRKWVRIRGNPLTPQQR